MLARREHSQRELCQKLTKKGFDRTDIDSLLDEFVDNNWQSNQRFAESYLRSRVSSGFGPIRIDYELKERGVDVDIHELHVMSEAPNWKSVLSDLHIKKYGLEAPLDVKERAKRIRFFQHKGYTSEMIQALFNDMY
jgi:regulatory protein